MKKTINDKFTLSDAKKRYARLALFIIWLGLQCFLFWQNGIVTTQEAVKYIDQANVFLSTGKYSSANFIFYSVQILLIAACIKFHISFIFLVLLQIICNGISIICFFKIVNKLSGSLLLSFFSTLYFLIFFYYYFYNTYLFTESLYFSFSVIYAYFLFSVKRLTIKNILLIFLLLSLLYLTRPTGIFFIPATFLFIIIKFYYKNSLKIIAASICVGLIFFYFLFNYSIGSGGEFDFLLPYLDERIICGVPTIRIAHNIVVPVEKNSIAGLLYIITHYSGLFFRLSIQRLAAFFKIYRPYYSVFHNVFASGYFYLMYAAILFHIKYLFKKDKAEVWFLITCIGLTVTTVMLSCDEWGNRFILSVLPFFLLLSVIAIKNKKELNG